jgi:hypothetical protein
MPQFRISEQFFFFAWMSEPDPAERKGVGRVV